MFTSITDLRYTPQDFFDKLHKIYNFNLDPCSDWQNNKCEKFFTEKEDWLKQNRDNQNVFMNPPYWKTIWQWIKKASEARGGVVVCLLPARTDTRYFHDYIYKKPNVEIEFIKWRLKFGWSKNAAPFPSMIVIFK